MAVSKVTIPILWGGAATKSLSTTSWFLSDEFTLDDSDWEAVFQARADNSGTPASGDTVELRLIRTAGDLDNGGGAADYPDVNTSGTTAAQGEPLGLLDTYNNYDPDGLTRSFPTSSSTCKLAARAGQGATRAITLAAAIKVHRGAIA